MIFRVTVWVARIKQDAERLRPADSEVMRLLCDNTRLREATGWSPEVDLADGIARTAEWLARPDNLARYKSTRYTI
jgi:nucleoside-diphosphate-sugar epimerase